MATWRAEIKLKNPGNFFPVTVEAGAAYEARQNIEHIYSPYTIRNLHQVSKSSISSSSSDDDSSVTAFVYLVGIAFILWIFASFTPWITMGIGGALGTWISEKITGQSLSEYADRSDNSGHGKCLIVLATALILGGYGFVKGVDIQKHLESSSSPPSQVKIK